MKKILISTGAIFVFWFLFDFLVHGVLLKGLYEQTASLWRPMAEIQGAWWMHLISIAIAFIFSWLWCCSVKNEMRNPKGGLCFGSKLGTIYGLSMGLGMYAVMPIPMALALSWMVASIVSFAGAGLIAALIIKDCCCSNKC